MQQEKSYSIEPEWFKNMCKGDNNLRDLCRQWDSTGLTEMHFRTEASMLLVLFMEYPNSLTTDEMRQRIAQLNLNEMSDEQFREYTRLVVDSTKN